MQNIDRAFQDMMDLGDKLEAVAEQYDASDRFKEEFLLWQDGRDGTEEQYVASAVYEVNLERYAEELYPPEDYE